VIAGDTVYFSGAREFLVVSLRTGAVAGRTALDSTTTHLFGQRVAVSSSLGVYPTTASLSVFDPATGAVTRQLSLPGGTLMTPLIAGSRLFAVSQDGVFFAIDAGSGQVQFQVPTGARQPVAGSVHVAGQLAFFVNRKGTVVCVDLDAHAVHWKASAPAGTGGIFQDIEVTPKGIFAFAGGSLYAFSPSDGSPLYPPITGVSTPPLVRDDTLYFGTEKGALAAVEAETGKRLKSLDLKETPTTRPQEDGPRILLGTASGQVLVIYPGTMP